MRVGALATLLWLRSKCGACSLSLSLSFFTGAFFDCETVRTRIIGVLLELKEFLI